MFSSVLIANRGEIAVRVIRTARKLGLRTIAVYSEPDVAALHVRSADEAYCIGAAEVAQSYLRGDRILEVARSAAAECIHPGYGFLSESATFAEACEQAGIAFVGPTPHAIRSMGLKDAAKQLMQSAGVPVVPGYHGELQQEDFLKQKAYELGYPLIIKAIAGGGGKGMRRVSRHQDFVEALGSCRREAKSAFGDDRVLLERFVANPRHIEVQVFGDMHGQALHLFERDCSMQRRHQKVIEEAPAPGMPESMRVRMGKAAVAAAKAVGYVGAGTVEFIADTSQGLNEDSFFFMEMNTRLQVEHPVTEAVTGVDLVEWQFRVAAGETLPLSQTDLGAPRGHAIEARLYAEDPENGFLPQTGQVVSLSWPSNEPGLRIDTGIEAGSEISPYYDPMIAKLIAWGETREEARKRLVESLHATTVLGLRTNLGFLAKLLGSAPFVSGQFDTGLIDSGLAGLVPQMSESAIQAVAAGLWMHHLGNVNARRAKRLSNEPDSPWSQMNGWALGGCRRDRIHLLINGKPASIDVLWENQGSAMLVGPEQTRLSGIIIQGNRFLTSVDGIPEVAVIHDDDDMIFAQWRGLHLEIRAQDLLDRDLDAAEGSSTIKAPMSGKLMKIFVAVGDEVERGDRLALLEAMKMEHALLSAGRARVKSVSGSEGDQVAEGQVVIILEALPPT